MAKSSVEITQSGRSGSIYYHEGTRTISFDWEFAASPALVLISGPSAAVWDQMHIWAAGRQERIFAVVAEEVIRQKAPGYRFVADLASGTITIFPSLKRSEPALMEAQAPTRRRDKHSVAYKRFKASMPRGYDDWEAGQCYDVAAIPKMNAAERKEIFQMLRERIMTWREVEALAMFPTAEARELIRGGLTHHLSIDVRLAAAAALERQGRMEEMESFLGRQIRLLHHPREGLRRALEMAEAHPTDNIKQALLWASYNRTECAPHCARLLLKLTGSAREPFPPEVEEMVNALGLHHSYFTRQAAFEKLLRIVGLELDARPEAI